MYTRFVGKTNSQQPGSNLLPGQQWVLRKLERLVSEFTNIIRDGHPEVAQLIPARVEFPGRIASLVCLQHRTHNGVASGYSVRPIPRSTSSCTFFKSLVTYDHSTYLRPTHSHAAPIPERITIPAIRAADMGFRNLGHLSSVCQSGAILYTEVACSSVPLDGRARSYIAILAA